MPLLIQYARTKNNARDGITNQNMLIDNSDTWVRSLVSSYKNINAIMEMNGNEARMAPQKLLFFDISDIKKISSAEPAILIK